MHPNKWFFSFANTITTTQYNEDENPGHGWMGVRFQLIDDDSDSIIDTQVLEFDYSASAADPTTYKPIVIGRERAMTASLWYNNTAGGAVANTHLYTCVLSIRASLDLASLLKARIDLMLCDFS